MRWRADGWVGLRTSFSNIGSSGDATVKNAERKEGVGWLTTRQMVLMPSPTNTLTINAKCSADFMPRTPCIRVEVLGEDGKPLPEFSGENAATFHGDAIHGELRWNSGRKLPTKMALNVSLEPGAQLFGFRWG